MYICIQLVATEALITQHTQGPLMIEIKFVFWYCNGSKYRLLQQHGILGAYLKLAKHNLRMRIEIHAAALNFLPRSGRWKVYKSFFFPINSATEPKFLQLIYFSCSYLWFLLYDRIVDERKKSCWSWKKQSSLVIDRSQTQVIVGRVIVKALDCFAIQFF